MISRSNPALQTVDPELLAEAMNRFVSSCSSPQLERAIVKSISTLDEPHKAAFARALTDDTLFADVNKIDESTLKDAVQISGRCGELHQSFLHFLRCNPRALEQLHPQIVNGIFAGMESPRVAFEETTIPRRSHDLKVGAFAALATLLLSALVYAGWGALRSQHRNDAAQVVLSTPIYQATPNPASLRKTTMVVHRPALRRRPIAPRPIIKRVFVKQIVVKEVQSQSVPAQAHVRASAASQRHVAAQVRNNRIALRPDSHKRVASISGGNRPTRPTQVPGDRSVKSAGSNHAAGKPAPMSEVSSSQPVIAAAPRPPAPQPAPVLASIQTPTLALTARDFVASTIRAAAPDTRITSLWVSDGGGDLTIVEAESANRGGTFYDKYAVRSAGGGFSIASHEQIPIEIASPHATSAASPAVSRKARALLGHIRRAHH